MDCNLFICLHTQLIKTFRIRVELPMIMQITKMIKKTGFMESDHIYMITTTS